MKLRLAHVPGAVAAALVLWPAAWHLRTIASLFRARLAYPFDIEWMEGGNVYHAYRVLHGLPLYVAPESGFAPFPYPPLYWAAVAAVGRLGGLDYATGRAVSVACIVATSVLLAAVVARHAPARWLGAVLGVVALASVAAGYPMAGGSYDIARNDAMAIALPVVAAALLGDGRVSVARALGVAALLVAALFTKQTAVFFVAWLVCFAMARRARSGVVLAGATAVASVLLFAWLQRGSGGWFGTWLFDQRHHPTRLDRWADPLAVVLRHAPFLLLLPWLVASLRRRRWLRPSTVKWVGMLAAALAATILVGLKDGSWLNTYIPALVLSWPVTLMALGDLLLGLWPRRARALVATWTALLFAGGLLQLLEYGTDDFVPPAERFQRAARLDALLRGMDGCVVVSTSPFVAIRAGKTCEQPILQAYVDAFNAGIDADYAGALAKSDASWVILTGRSAEDELPRRIEPAFELVGDVGFGLESMADWDEPSPATLWHRRAPLDVVP